MRYKALWNSQIYRLNKFSTYIQFQSWGVNSKKTSLCPNSFQSSMLYNITFSLLDIKCTPHKHSMLNFPFNQRAYIGTSMNFVPVFSRFSFFVVVDDVRQRSSQFAFFSINILSSGISSQKCNQTRLLKSNCLYLSLGFTLGTWDTCSLA